MGIPNFLSVADLQTLNLDVLNNLKNRGFTKIGFDGYVLLHQFLCVDNIAERLVNNPNAKIDYIYENIIKKIKLFEPMGFSSFVVFDGNKMNYKKTEKNREELRRKAFEKGNYAYAVDITPIQAYYLKEYLDRENIPSLVAPFEADVQLAYLSKIGMIDIVYTNDTDLIVYGTKRIIFQRPKTELQYYESREPEFKGTDKIIEQKVKKINDLVRERLIIYALMVGCDYFKGIKLYGIKKSLPIIQTIEMDMNIETHEVDWEKTINSIIILCNLNKTIIDDIKETKKGFLEGIKCYLKQPVYDPRNNRIVCYDESISEINDFGEIKGKIEDLINCKIDPITGEQFN